MECRSLFTQTLKCLFKVVKYNAAGRCSKSSRSMGSCHEPYFQLFPLGVGYLKYMVAYGGKANFQLLWNEKCIYTLLVPRVVA